MANLNHVPTRFETKTVVVEPEKFVLELTPSEARSLLTVLAMVTGSPENSRRKHTQAIFNLLIDSGVPYSMADLKGDSEIFFNSNSLPEDER